MASNPSPHFVNYHKERFSGSSVWLLAEAEKAVQHYGLQEEGCLAPLLSEAETLRNVTEQVDIINLSSLPWSQHIHLVQVKDALGKAVPGQQMQSTMRNDLGQPGVLNNSNGRVSVLFISFTGNHLESSGPVLPPLLQAITQDSYKVFWVFPWPRSANVTFAWWIAIPVPWFWFSFDHFWHLTTAAPLLGTKAVPFSWPAIACSTATV